MLRIEKKTIFSTTSQVAQEVQSIFALSTFRK